MALLGSLGKKMYSAATSRAGATAIIAGAGAAGLYKSAARPAADAAMEVALGDPNADEYFVGEKLSPMILGGGMIGGMGNMAKYASPQYYEDFSPVAKPSVGLGFTGGVGALIGSMAGKGAKGRMMGGAIGGLIGTGIGLAGYAALASNRGSQGLKTPYAGNRRLDQNTMSYSDRNVSLSNAEQLNSYGDIVFGLHNLRRG